MQKTVYIIITLALIIAIGIIFTGGEKESKQSVEIRDGIQYITILASGGYSPRVTEAQSGIPTKLIMKTNGSFDCSSALMIRSIGFQQILPQTGETEIDIGIPKAGEPLEGVCSMGMYNFTVNFK
ncbi:MAG: cupredoxin domain-containing protein [bacterium]|nr:cupredoxin domain-containing protein [bacterium]